MLDEGGVTFTNVSVTPPSRLAAHECKPILRDISLQLQPRTTTALLGRSGSGKTTLLRTVNGLVLPTEGSIRSLGVQVDSSTTPEQLRSLRHRIGYVIQETGLFPHMTIERNVALPLELRGEPGSNRRQRAADLLESVGLSSEEYAHRFPHQLSGGQRQRVGLARSLASEPKLLLLDEPFGALDPLTRAEMQTMLRDLLCRLQMIAVIVTHDLQEALFVADRVLFVADGRIHADLSASDVLNSADPGVLEYTHAAHRPGAAQQG